MGGRERRCSGQDCGRWWGSDGTRDEATRGSGFAVLCRDEQGCGQRPGRACNWGCRLVCAGGANRCVPQHTAGVPSQGHPWGRSLGAPGPSAISHGRVPHSACAQERVCHRGSVGTAPAAPGCAPLSVPCPPRTRCPLQAELAARPLFFRFCCHQLERSFLSQPGFQGRGLRVRDGHPQHPRGFVPRGHIAAPRLAAPSVLMGFAGS